jgi:MoxR-like ATPase
MAPVEIASRPTVSQGDSVIVDRVIAAAREFGTSRFIVLAGLPGTGKSRLARIVADQLTDGDPLRLKDIQFHESTAYEDFMEGFVPRPDGHGFERRDKTFRIINQRALDDPNRSYVLLIEEFTRANVHSVLGELLTFIEHRSRPFTLSLSQDEISIAPGLIVLATMNPRDRSAITLDDAVTRRMHRIPIPPSKDALLSMLNGVLAEPHLSELAQWFERHMDTLPFGHGVFAGADSSERLSSIWEGTILPLLSDPLGRILDAYKTACAEFPFIRDAGPPVSLGPRPS